jgi:hypothetical protein
MDVYDKGDKIIEKRVSENRGYNMNELFLKQIKKIIEEGRLCPYMQRDTNLDTYCTTYVDCECGYQGSFVKDKITYRICRREVLE